MINYTELSYDELISIIDNHSSIFLCGNGLSINFDDGYTAGKLSERLFETHCHIIDNTDFEVFSGEKYNSAIKENFHRTIDVIKPIKSREDFDWFFSCALEFAKSIVYSKKALKWLNDNNYNYELGFGLSTIMLLETIVTQANKYGIFNINYEYLTIIIYFVIAMKKAPQEIYNFDITNLFVQAVLWGCKYGYSKPQGNNALYDAPISGMFAYYRFLYASNILMGGKSVEVEKLQNWNSVDRQALNVFLNRFDNVMTTNYDKILENITKQHVYHLHGQFTKDKKIVLYQSLGVNYGFTRYDISSITIGDYFLSKSILPIATNMAANNRANTPTDFHATILQQTIKDAHAEAIVILGLNIENDYHILREIQFYFAVSGVKAPKIIFCYFTDADKDSFLDSYNKCITYSEELSKIVRDNIEIYVIKTQDVLKNIL